MNSQALAFACIRDQVCDARTAKIHASAMPEGDQRREMEEYGRACTEQAKTWFARRHGLPLDRYGFPKA